VIIWYSENVQKRNEYNTQLTTGFQVNPGSRLLHFFFSIYPQFSGVFGTTFYRLMPHLKPSSRGHLLDLILFHLVRLLNEKGHYSLSR